MRQRIRHSKLEVMTIPLDDFLGLELECFYCYEPPVPADDINPEEQAIVTLQEVYLGQPHIEISNHLNIDQWKRLEQVIYDHIDRDF